MMTAHNNYFIITQGQASRLFPHEHDPQTPDWYMYAHMDMWDGFILHLQYQNSASLLQKGGLWGLLQAILLHLDTISLYDTCVFLCEYSLEMNGTLRV